MKVVRTIETIARGGFGKVDKVLLDSGREVARKTFDPKPPHGQTWDIDKLRQRFIREVKTQACLDKDLFDRIPSTGEVEIS